MLHKPINNLDPEPSFLSYDVKWTLQLSLNWQSVVSSGLKSFVDMEWYLVVWISSGLISMVDMEWYLVVWYSSSLISIVDMEWFVVLRYV